MTVKQLLAAIDSRELSEWQAYDRLEPLDHAARGELSAGIIASVLANTHRDPNKHEPYTAADFMQTWGKEWRESVTIEIDKRERLEQQMAIAMALMGIHWE
jgi:hypothetical protein